MRTVIVTLVLALAACSARFTSRVMPDNKRWTTANLNIDIAGSHCYDDSEANCRRFGRLYTWEAARNACQALGRGWRLPTDDEWRQLAAHYGGVRGYSKDDGRSAYKALFDGGSSGFNALYGGNRNANNHAYERIDAHGFYWTATETAPGAAWFYNFGRGGQIVNRHAAGDKSMAISVRCINSATR